MAAVLAESMVGGIRFHPDVIQSEAPEFRSSTTLAHSPCLRHATGIVYLDNAFVLIEVHPLDGSLTQKPKWERPSHPSSRLSEPWFWRRCEIIEAGMQATYCSRQFGCAQTTN